MNRRGFFSRLAAAIAAPSLLPAAKAAQAPTAKPAIATNETRQNPAGFSPIGMSPDQFVAAIKGNYPLSHRGTRTEGWNTIVEFDVLAACSYTPPSWLDLGRGFPRGLVFGDILAIYVRSDPVLDPTKAALVHGTSQWLIDL